MSGNAEFPHLHFAVRFQDKSIDPFTGPGGPGDCKRKQPGAGSLWTARAAQALHYQPTAVIAIAFAPAVPAASVADRAASIGRQGRMDPIILWADIFGSQTGDIQRFRIIDPNQDSLLDQSKKLDQGHLSWFTYAGRRAPEGGWKQGRYIGTYELMRGSAIVARGRSETVIQ